MPSPSDMPSPIGGVFCFYQQIHPVILAWLPFEVFSVLKFDVFKNRFQPDSLPRHHEVWCSCEETPRSPAVSWINCLWIQTPNPNSCNPPLTSSTSCDDFMFWNSDNLRTDFLYFRSVRQQRGPGSQQINSFVQVRFQAAASSVHEPESLGMRRNGAVDSIKTVPNSNSIPKPVGKISCRSIHSDLHWFICQSALLVVTVFYVH